MERLHSQGDHREIPRFTDRILRVRYEDLVADHRGGVETLLEFCGLAITPAIVDEIVAATALEAQRGNYACSTRKGEVGDWRSHLTASEIEAVHIVGQTMLERLGYEVPPSTS